MVPLLWSSMTLYTVNHMTICGKVGKKLLYLSMSHHTETEGMSICHNGVTSCLATLICRHHAWHIDVGLIVIGTPHYPFIIIHLRWRLHPA